MRASKDKDMITTSECIKVEAMALPSLPRERKRELYLSLREAGFKTHRFALTDRAKAETRRDELKARARGLSLLRIRTARVYGGEAGARSAPPR